MNALENHLRRHLKQTTNEMLIEQLAVRGNAGNVRVLREGLYFQCGTIKEGPGETWFTATQTTLLATEGNVTFHDGFQQFWEALPDAEQKHLRHLNEVHTLDPQGGVKETLYIGSKESMNWAQYPQRQDLADFGHIIRALLTKVYRLEDKCSQLEKRLDEVFYAPGMPGFEAARKDFAMVQATR